MKQTIEIEVEVPDGYKAVYDNNTQKVEIVRVGLPKTWEEFCENYPISSDEHFIRENSTITEASYMVRKQIVFRGKNEDKNLLPNKETAEAFLALMQLVQLRDCYRQGWTPDWNDGNNKFSIEIIDGEITTFWDNRKSRILSFQSIEVRDEFLNNFRGLIEEAKELI